MLFKIQNSKKDEPQSQFSQLKQQTLNLPSLQFLQSQQTPNKLYYFVFYLGNLILDNSTVPCGFDIRL